jgi:stage V sporulation protein AD
MVASPPVGAPPGSPPQEAGPDGESRTASRVATAAPETLAGTGMAPGRTAHGRTAIYARPPVILAASSVAGPFEGQGPLGGSFDEVTADTRLGQPSWEKAERTLLVRAVNRLAAKAHLRLDDIELLFAGDLLNQLVTCSFAARDLDIPYAGVYAACATLTLGFWLAAAAVAGGAAGRVAVAVVSHHDAAERQYRFPVEFGNQRPPTATWTATGAAAFLLGGEGGAVHLTAATMGRVVDLGVTDPFDMGSAMAPAAADTIARHLEDTGRRAGDFDLIATGDLSRVGRPLAEELLRRRGIDVSLADCGIRLYDANRQDVHAGGSGAACSGLVLAGQLLPALQRRELRRVLLVSTGALHSPTTYQQRETIPGVAHAVCLEAAPQGG